MANLNKRALFVLSEWGYWGEELIGPMEVLEKNGYKIDFATAKGNRAACASSSLTR